MNRILQRLLERPVVYALWQRPFVEKKLEPLAETDVFKQTRKVLDVGCGPGTNAARFAHADYTGIDLNPLYIRKAQRDFEGRFLVGDASRLQIDGRFDCILANSLFHHLDDEATDRSLEHLKSRLALGGRIHIIDLVLPPRPGIPRALARLDRGNFPRPLADWRAIVSRHFELTQIRPYSLRLAGIALWDLVYLQGRSKG